MTTQKAIERLDDMQGQIIHGKNTFGEIADMLRDAEKALDTASVAVGNEHETYSLARRIEWLADVMNSYRCRVVQLRAEQESRTTAILATIGGTVEGLPTSSVNFLQRLRELVANVKCPEPVTGEPNQDWT